MSNIGIIGAGYVGLVTGFGFAQLGHRINFIDLDKDKVSKLNNGKLPFYEPGLDQIITNKEIKSRVSYSSDYSKELIDLDVVFICVQTPEGDDEKANLKFLYDALNSTREAFGKDTIVCIKSTFPPTFLDELREHIDDVDSLVFNPEFLREGSALHDFNNPDRIVIGGSKKRSLDFILDLYKNFESEIILTDAVTALLIKYLSNAYLPMRLSFVNESLQIGDALGADIPVLLEGVGADKRIGKDYFRPSPGWGGSCFPKDTKSLKGMLNDRDLVSPLINAIDISNEKHSDWSINKIIEINTSVQKSNIVLYGAAFKENTDDMRDSPTIKIYEKLKAAEINVHIFDEFESGLDDSITELDEINDSLVVLMYPSSDLETIKKKLKSNNNAIFIPWDNKVL